MSTAMASEIKLPAKKNEVTNFIYDYVKISLFNYRSAALRRRRRRRTLEVTMCRSLSLSHTSPLALAKLEDILSKTTELFLLVRIWVSLLLCKLMCLPRNNISDSIKP